MNESVKTEEGNNDVRDEGEKQNESYGTDRVRFGVVDGCTVATKRS